jgi:hypothetical protein
MFPFLNTYRFVEFKIMPEHFITVCGLITKTKGKKKLRITVNKNDSIRVAVVPHLKRGYTLQRQTYNSLKLV